MLRPHLYSPAPPSIQADRARARTGSRLKNKMFQRIYGISFPEKAMLEEYPQKLEAKARPPQNRSGDIRSTSSRKGPFPLLFPQGNGFAQARTIMPDSLGRGLSEIKTPVIPAAAVGDLRSPIITAIICIQPPHESEFAVADELALRPACLQAQIHSYRDPPLLRAGTCPPPRAGHASRTDARALLHQDDAHIFMTPEQIKDEIIGVYKSSTKLFDFRVKLHRCFRRARKLHRYRRGLGASDRRTERRARRAWRAVQDNEGDGAFFARNRLPHRRQPRTHRQCAISALMNLPGCSTSPISGQPRHRRL